MHALKIPPIDETSMNLDALNELYIPSKKLVKGSTLSQIEMEFYFHASRDQSKVVIETIVERNSNKVTSFVSIDQFKQILYECLSENTPFEEHPDIKCIIDNHLEKHSKEFDLYVPGKRYHHTDGIGLVMDRKRNKEVGVFESFECIYREQKTEAFLRDLTLMDKDFEQLFSDEYTFIYYCPAEKTVCKIEKYSVSSFEDDNKYVLISNPRIKKESFQEDHPSFDYYAAAIEKRAQLKGKDKDHPLFEKHMQELRESRFQLLKESNEQKKKEKIISQFADIDL